MYSLNGGYRRPLGMRIASTLINALAIAGWVVLIIIVVAGFTGYLDDLILIGWEI